MRRAWIPVLAAAACGGSSRSEGVEAILARDVAAQLGAEVTVTCPTGPFPKACAVHVPGGDDLTIDVAEDRHAYLWSLRGFVIATAPLVEAIQDELTELGVAGEIACGPALKVVAVGDRVRCDLALGHTLGAAWARILDDDGDFELELALTAAAVQARTIDYDLDALTRESRALDRDDAVGDGDEAAAADAGALGSPR